MIYQQNRFFLVYRKMSFRVQYDHQLVQEQQGLIEYVNEVIHDSKH
jgi:hypothetical protein